jgi:hypothetical protein
VQLITPMPRQVFIDRRAHERVAEGIANKTFFKEAQLQGAVKRVEQRRVGDRRLERLRSGPERGQLDFSSASGGRQPDQPPQRVVGC